MECRLLKENNQDRAVGRWWEHRLFRVKELLKLGFKGY